MTNTTSPNDTPTGHAAVDPSAVFTANLHAVNLMQQRVFCNQAQAVEDPAKQKRLLKCSQAITDLIRDVIG